MALINKLQTALTKAVTLINDIGTTATFTPKDTGKPVVLKIMQRELQGAELVADFRQGDLKIELDASKLVAQPKKYDTLTIGARKYTVKDKGFAARMVGDQLFTYKFIVRGD